MKLELWNLKTEKLIQLKGVISFEAYDKSQFNKQYVQVTFDHEVETKYDIIKSINYFDHEIIRGVK